MSDINLTSDQNPILTSVKGIQYQIGDKLNSVNTYQCTRCSDRKEYLYREIHTFRTEQDLRILKHQLLDFMTKLPDEEFCIADIIEDRQRSGCVLESEKDFILAEKLWDSDNYPDAMSLCKMGFNIAKALKKIHMQGFICADGMEEGRITVRLSDMFIHLHVFDTVSPGEVVDRFGTEAFCAPEWHKRHIFDLYTDYYAMAVCFYRMLVGKFPSFGDKTDEPIAQTQREDALPEPIKECFFKTFSAGIKEENRKLRASDRDWMQAFQKCRFHMRKCPSCGKAIFKNQRICTCGYKEEALSS